MANIDEQFVLSLMEKFNSSVITELTIEDGTARLVLRKGQIEESAGRPVPVPAAGKIITEKSIRNESASPPGQGVPDSGVSDSGKEKITSPIVGTFYASPGPDAPPFVKPGAKAKAGETLCILEAMKMMNHLEAEFDCEIIEVHAGSGEFVEYGQNLFTVKRL